MPFLLFGFGLIGFLNLQSAWADIAKSIQPHMSPAAFAVVQDTAKKVLTQKQLCWVTLGFALAIWEVSGGIRSIMGGLNQIYEIDERRIWTKRTTRSILIALAVSVLVLAAIAIAWVGPLLYGDVGQPLGALFFLARWLVRGFLLGSGNRADGPARAGRPPVSGLGHVRNSGRRRRVDRSLDPVRALHPLRRLIRLDLRKPGNDRDPVRLHLHLSDRLLRRSPGGRNHPPPRRGQRTGPLGLRPDELVHPGDVGLARDVDRVPRPVQRTPTSSQAQQNMR